MPATNPDWMPHIVVATIVEHEGRFLLIEERIAGELVLNQPAGHWEPGETLVEGAIRETIEESGWDVEPTDFLGIYEWQPEGLAYPFVRFAFAAKALQHHPDRTLDAGIERAVWLTYEEVVQQTSRLRSPSVLTCIEDYRAGQLYPLSMIRHLAPR